MRTGTPKKPNQDERREVRITDKTDHNHAPGLFTPLRETLIDRGDYFRHLADLNSYTNAQQQLGELYADSDAWTRMAIQNVAGSGKFSSDRTIAEYAAEIWNVVHCPVESCCLR
jgi:starch phosphorylase